MNDLWLCLQFPRAVNQLEAIPLPPTSLVDEREYGYSATWILWPPSKMEDAVIPPGFTRIEKPYLSKTSRALWSRDFYYAPDDLLRALSASPEVCHILMSALGATTRRDIARPHEVGLEELQKLLKDSPCLQEVWKLLPASHFYLKGSNPYPFGLITEPLWTADLLVAEVESYYGTGLSCWYEGDVFYFHLLEFIERWLLPRKPDKRDVGPALQAHPAFVERITVGRIRGRHIRFWGIRGQAGGEPAPL